MKYLFRTLLAAVAVTAASVAMAEPYRVIVPMSDDDEGAMARLINYDDGTTIDSVLVDERAATFEGTIDEPMLARVLVDGRRNPIFILESGTISFNATEGAFGTMLNDQLRQLGRTLGALERDYGMAATDDARQAIAARYDAVMDSAMTANEDNALGYYLFLSSGVSQLDAPALREQLAKYPAFAGRARVQTMLEAAQRREATQPGGKMVNFSVVQPDGKTLSLSDFVGKGKYTLVDFWASWCGPCRRQIPVIKELYTRFGGPGGKLEVLGVAVWDKLGDTQRAITEEGITWPNILDAGTIPTDLYGITGIPCIILFGPDGTIISRDKQGPELVAEVEAALSK